MPAIKKTTESATWKEFRQDIQANYPFGECVVQIHEGEPVKIIWERSKNGNKTRMEDRYGRFKKGANNIPQ